jgi:single-strand DNA-binding protein
MKKLLIILKKYMLMDRMIRSRNLVEIIGNVGKDPEIRQGNSSKIAVFSVATSEEWKSKDGESKSQTEWHRVIAYRNLADMVETGLRKGMKVCIFGKIKSSKWQDKNTGEEKTGFHIDADDIFIGMNNRKQYSEMDEQPENEEDIPF